MSFFSAQSDNSRNGLILSMILLFSLLTLVLPRWITGDISLSPVSGLMAQRSLVQQSTPYDVALSNGKPTLIEFYADWCTTCQSFAPTLQEVHDKLGSQVNFVMLDIDNPQWKEPIQQFHATGVPHLTLLDTDHNPVETWIGKVPQSLLLNRVGSLLSTFGSF